MLSLLSRKRHATLLLRRIGCAWFVCASACGLPAGQPAAPFAPPRPQGTVLAQVGDVAITDAQLVAYEGVAADAGDRPRFAALMGKVEDRVRFELLAQAAADRGLMNDPEVVEVARKTMVRKLLADEMGSQKLGRALDENAALAYYAQHRGSYQQPELRRFVLLAFGNDALGRSQAEAFARVWQNGHDDAQALAAALKVRTPGPTKAAGSRRRARAPLRWQEQPFLDQRSVARSFGDDVASAVFARPPAQIPSPVVESQRGPVAVRVLACRAAQARAYPQARADIVEQLLRSKRAQSFQAFLEQIRASYPIAIYEDRIRAWAAHPGPASGGATSYVGGAGSAAGTRPPTVPDASANAPEGAAATRLRDGAPAARLDDVTPATRLEDAAPLPLAGEDDLPLPTANDDAAAAPSDGVGPLPGALPPQEGPP